MICVVNAEHPRHMGDGNMSKPPLDQFEPFEPGPRKAYEGTLKTSGAAIASFVLGLLSVFACLTIFAAVPAMILGTIALVKIDRAGSGLKGRGFAIAGLIFGGLGVLIMPALLLPAVQSAREAARRAQCMNNLKQIALAMHNYHDTYNSFPPAAATDASGHPILSWRVLLLPYLDQNSLYEQFHLDEPWDSEHNKPLLGLIPNCYRCPSDPSTEPTTGYQVINGKGALFDSYVHRIADVTDGTANTLLCVEAARPVPWSQPTDVSFDATKPDGGLIGAMKSFHPHGFNASFVDGSVRFLKSDIDPQVLRALATRSGDEIVTLP
jgi:prepilin-type processing-associated H-X9-DG protein